MRGRFAAAALTVIVLSGGSAVAQSLSAPELKAAYLFNFAQFAEWPADVMPAGETLSLCVDNDGAVADALEQTSKGRTVKGHGLTVRRLKADAPLPACHVLFLGGSDVKRSVGVMGTARDLSVFTVSDAARFAETGGIVELFLEDGRIRLAVNLDALQRARIKLSSRVLGLSKIVRDAPAR